jgi:hypothetical protein
MTPDEVAHPERAATNRPVPKKLNTARISPPQVSGIPNLRIEHE